MLMSKKEAIEFLDKKIPDNAYIELFGSMAEPRPTDRAFNYGLTHIKATDIVTGVQFEDQYELRVRYTVK